MSIFTEGKNKQKAVDLCLCVSADSSCVNGGCGAWSVIVYGTFVWECALQISVLRIRDVYPGSWFLSILYIQQQQQKGGGNLLSLSYLFWSHKYHTIEIILFFYQVKKEKDPVHQEL